MRAAKKTGTRPCLCKQCDVRRKGLGGLNTKGREGLGGVALKSVPVGAARRRLLDDLVRAAAPQRYFPQLTACTPPSTTDLPRALVVVSSIQTAGALFPSRRGVANSYFCIYNFQTASSCPLSPSRVWFRPSQPAPTTV